MAQVFSACPKQKSFFYPGEREREREKREKRNKYTELIIRLLWFDMKFVHSLMLAGTTEKWMGGKEATRRSMNKKWFRKVRDRQTAEGNATKLNHQSDFKVSYLWQMYYFSTADLRNLKWCRCILGAYCLLNISPWEIHCKCMTRKVPVDSSSSFFNAGIVLLTLCLQSSAQPELCCFVALQLLLYTSIAL